MGSAPRGFRSCDLVGVRTGSGVASAAAGDRAHGATPFALRATRVPGWARLDSIRFWDIDKCGGRLAVVEKSIYSAEYQRLCALLRQLREEAGLTQVQVAAELGVPQSFVSKYESGERRLDVIELKHVAQALKVTVWVVLERLKL